MELCQLQEFLVLCDLFIEFFHRHVLDVNGRGVGKACLPGRPGCLVVPRRLTSMIGFGKRTPFSDALVILSGMTANDHLSFHLHSKVIFHKIDRG